MSYSFTPSPRSKGNWYDTPLKILLILFGIFVVGYLYLWQLIFKKIQQGLEFTFSRYYQLGTSESGEWATYIAVLVTMLLIGSVFLAFVWSRKSLIVTVAISLIACGMWVTGSHLTRDEKLIKTIYNPEDRIFCTGGFGPKAEKGEVCRATGLPGQKATPQQLWSWLALADDKAPRKLKLTPDQLRELPFSRNSLPLIFASPTLNSDGVYDLYEGGGAGERNIAGTFSDLLIPATEEHRVHNLRIQTTTYGLVLEKLLDQKKARLREASSQLTSAENAYRADVEEKARLSQKVILSNKILMRVPPGMWVAEMESGIKIYIVHGENQNATYEQYNGPLDEQSQSAYIGRLIVTFRDDSCGILGWFCPDKTYWIRQSSATARAAVATARNEETRLRDEVWKITQNIASLKISAAEFKAADTLKEPEKK